MLGYLRRNLKDTRLSSRPGESSSAKPKTTQITTNRQETTRRTATTQESHSKLEFDFAVPGQSKRRSDESPRRHSDYSRESGSPSRKRSRHSGNSSGETTRIFVVQKDSGSWRPIIDLSTLNTFIVSQRFHMETPQSVLRSIRQADWMISLDLQDAYLQVPNPPGITSIYPLHHGRSSIPVQGIVFRANNCPSGLYKAHSSNIRHSPSLRYQNAPISRRLVDLSRVQGHLYSSEGRAPTSVRGVGTTSEPRQVITGSISDHDLPRNADLISSVHCETNRDKGNEPPQHNRGVSLVPEPPSSSLATSSGPPFVPHPSSEGRDAKNAISSTPSPIQVELSRRLPSHSMGPSVPGGSSMVVRDDTTEGGSRPFPPSAGLELLLRHFRRRLGRDNRGTTSIRSVDSMPKTVIHQPQGDVGSTERPPEVRPVPQRQDDRLVLRQCHNSRLSQAIGRHKVSGPVPQGQGNPPVDRIYENHDSPPVHPGSSQHESGPPQSAEPGNRIRVDATPGGGPGSSPPVAGDHRPVCNLADGQAPCVLCPSGGTQGDTGRCISPTLGQPAGIGLPSNSHHKESSSQTENLSPLRSNTDRTLLASKGVVSRSSGAPVRHSNRATQTSRSAAATAFPSASRKSPNASADCVATLQLFTRQTGFSRAVADQLALSRRTSTRLNYQARWGKFRK